MSDNEFRTSNTEFDFNFFRTRDVFCVNFKYSKIQLTDYQAFTYFHISVHAK